MTANKALVKFIKEGRRRGFDDYQLRQPLLQNGWAPDQVDAAFASFKAPIKFKNKICVYLDNTILAAIEKRAKKNMLSPSEQIEDIVRRSVVNQHHPIAETDKLDDMLITLFSRKTRKK